MEERDLIRLNQAGAVILAEPETILAASREAYDFGVFHRCIERKGMHSF